MHICLWQPIRTFREKLPTALLFLNLETKHAKLPFLCLERRNSSQVWPPTHPPSDPWPLIPQTGKVEPCCGWELSQTTDRLSLESLHSQKKKKKRKERKALFKKPALLVRLSLLHSSTEMFSWGGVCVSSDALVWLRIPGRLCGMGGTCNSHKPG